MIDGTFLLESWGPVWCEPPRRLVHWTTPCRSEGTAAAAASKSRKGEGRQCRADEAARAAGIASRSSLSTRPSEQQGRCWTSRGQRQACRSNGSWLSMATVPDGGVGCFGDCDCARQQRLLGKDLPERAGETSVDSSAGDASDGDGVDDAADGGNGQEEGAWQWQWSAWTLSVVKSRSRPGRVEVPDQRE